MNDVIVNDYDENGYEMKKIAGSRNQNTDMGGSACRLRGREWSSEEERFEFRMKLSRR